MLHFTKAQRSVMAQIVREYERESDFLNSRPTSGVLDTATIMMQAENGQAYENFTSARHLLMHMTAVMKQGK